jgi:hypothetical protein
MKEKDLIQVSFTVCDVFMAMSVVFCGEKRG